MAECREGEVTFTQVPIVARSPVLPVVLIRLRVTDSLSCLVNSRLRSSPVRSANLGLPHWRPYYLLCNGVRSGQNACFIRLFLISFLLLCRRITLHCSPGADDGQKA